MVHPRRDGLRRLQEAARAVGEFLEIHEVRAPFWTCPKCSGARRLTQWPADFRHVLIAVVVAARGYGAAARQAPADRRIPARQRIALAVHRASVRRLHDMGTHMRKFFTAFAFAAGLSLAATASTAAADQRRAAGAAAAADPVQRAGRAGQHPVPDLHARQRPARRRPRGPQGAGRRGQRLVQCRLQGRAAPAAPASPICSSI